MFYKIEHGKFNINHGSYIGKCKNIARVVIQYMHSILRSHLFDALCIDTSRYGARLGQCHREQRLRVFAYASNENSQRVAAYIFVNWRAQNIYEAFPVQER